MNTFFLRKLSIWLALLCVTGVFTCAVAATHKTPAAPPETAASAASSAVAEVPAADSADQAGDFDDDVGTHVDTRRDGHRRHARFNRDGDVVNIGHDSFLAEGERADSVVSIFGSSTNEGETNTVVSVIGDTRVTGPVRDSAVAVLGNTYVDSKVDDAVVAVLGNVVLGPHAEVGGNVVAVLGTVTRDPAAIVRGGIQDVFSINIGSGNGNWLNTWIKHCLLYLRPLALVPGLGWAWTLALTFLAFYVFLALLFRRGIDDCVHTVETQPGRTALAGLLAMLFTPVLLVLLCVTVIGIAAVPFVVIALFCASLFGKAVMLAWVGGRVSGRRPGAVGHPAIAVLIGGAIVLVLYIVPILGLVVYKLLGFFGFGAVVYTLILASRARRADRVGAPPGGGTASAGGAPGGAASAGGAAFTTGAAAAASAAQPEASPGAGTGPGADTSANAGASAGAGASWSTTPGPSGPQPISAAMPRAGFWPRMGALLLDILLVGFVVSLLHPFGHVHLVILAIYGAVMWKLRGTTVGGIVFDQHVVRVDGRPIDWETAIVRALGCFLSLAAAGLGFFWIAFDDNHQAWHDKIAGTVVVRVRRADRPLV
jgi:uncharacterized RDD family membrane protein YckC